MDFVWCQSEAGRLSLGQDVEELKPKQEHLYLAALSTQPPSSFQLGQIKFHFPTHPILKSNPALLANYLTSSTFLLTTNARTLVRCV